VTCDDGNVCTDDNCSPDTGCHFDPNNNGCDDGNQCTENDVCQGGQCVGGNGIGCDDSNLCTDDSCDPKSGCVFVPNNNPCNDGSECTTPDNCQGGSCQPGPPLACDDGNQCTSDACDDQVGCKYTPLPDDTGCGPGGWTCQAGQCQECANPHGNKTFNYTGSQQSFKVPTCVSKVTIEVWGAQGGGSKHCNGSTQDDGGKGGYAKGDLAVVPGETLYIYVGAKGAVGGSGGWNGGGNAGQYAGGGGGATDVRQGGTNLNHRKVVGGAGAGGQTG